MAKNLSNPAGRPPAGATVRVDEHSTIRRDRDPPAYYDVLRRTTKYYDVLRRTPTYYHVLRRTTTYYDVLRRTTRTATYYDVLR
eukprot:12109420-Alexandrium_andersonii.AAC.1